MAVSTIGASGLNSAVSQIGKNLVTNGGANVSQRGTQTGQYNAYTAVDQFWFQEAGSVQARFTTTQDGSGGGGHANSLKLDCTTAESTVAAGDILNLQHRIEAQHLQHLQWGTASAKDVTLSFWMSSPKTGTHCVSLYQADATRSYIAEFTIAAINTFEYFSVTIPGDTGGTINDDTGPGLYVSFPLFSGSNWQAAAGSWLGSQDYTTSNQQNLADNTSNNIFVTGVQLEVGSVATDFEHEPFSVTLAKCQRYFQRFSDLDAGMAFANGHAITTTRTRAAIMLPVRLRDETYGGFTFAFSDISHISVRQTNAAYAASSITTYASAAGQIVYVDLTVATMPNAGMAVNYESDTNNAYFEVSAEL